LVKLTIHDLPGSDGAGLALSGVWSKISGVTHAIFFINGTAYTVTWQAPAHCEPSRVSQLVLLDAFNLVPFDAGRPGISSYF